MYIEPNSVIKIMKNVPLDNTYSHTIYFESKSAQTSYFSSPSVVKYSLTAQSYQRVVKGKMRIEKSADNLYDCNYLAFQNTNFGNKWFYAFITSVEYVNNSTAEIQFEIDVMQTYHFDYEIKDCFVEREHAMDDTIGANTLKEPVEVGGADVFQNTDEYFTDWSVVINANPGTITKLLKFSHATNKAGLDNAQITIQTISNWISTHITIDFIADLLNGVLQLFNLPLNFLQAMYDKTAEIFELPEAISSVINHMYTGGVYWTKHIDSDNEQVSASEIALFIDTYLTPLGYNINDMYMCPSSFIGARTSQPMRIDVDPIFFTPASRFAYMSKNELYTPKNNKLRTSPYTYFRMTNNQGTNIDLAYERMVDGAKHLDMYVNWIGGVEASIQMPKYGAETSHEDRTTQLTISNFPKCSWSEGGIGQVLLSTIKHISTNMIGTLVSTNMTYPSPGGSRPSRNIRYINDFIGFENQKLTDGFNTVNSIIGETTNLRGNVGSGNLDVAYQRLGFTIYGMAITGEQAEVIDNFFEHYGYSTMLNKVPNRNGRPHWNYVKTKDCYVVANAPSESVRKICSIYDNGITFWKNPSEVGNYNLDNHI